ncbi:ribbon-helix-helix protein, CopG family [Nostoc sp.]
MADEKQLNIRIPEKEMDVLERYCKQTSRTKTDVLRELIRSLSKKVSKSE